MSNGATDTSALARTLALGFVAGAVAVAIFHQLMVLVLIKAGISQGTFYNMAPVPPFGIPWVVNQMFWGGVWGVVFALIVDRLPAWPVVVVGFLFGVIGPVLFGWTVMALIRHQPMFAGFVPMRMLPSILINGCYGIGLALIYAWLRGIAAPRTA
jgi:hypothetical protein